jgi:hypothetical protein
VLTYLKKTPVIMDNCQKIGERTDTSIYCHVSIMKTWVWCYLGMQAGRSNNEGTEYVRRKNKDPRLVLA